MTTELVAHSVRIGPSCMNAALDALKDVSGVIVVKHSHELNEKDHLHVYYPHIGVSSRNALDALKIKAKVIFGMPDRKLTNADWSWSNPNTSIEAFWRYAMYEKGSKQVYARVGAVCSIWNVGDEKPSPPPARPSNQIINIVNSATTRLTTSAKQAKFYKYVKEYVKENPIDSGISYTDLTGMLYEYSTGGFNENAAPQYVEYAMYHYCKDNGEHEKAAQSKSAWISRIMSRMKK